MFPDIIEYKVGFDEAVKIIRSKDPNVKSEREEQNWITKEEIKSIYDSMYEKYKPILKSKQTLTANEIADLSNFILLAVSSGILISPRRSMDWTEMKIRNYSTEDNYYHQGKFYFNKYKTGSVYGTQILPAPKQLRDIMKWYIEKNPNDYLLVNHFGTKLGESSITPRLNKIFGGKKISTTMLRHIYLSDYHKNTPALSEMTKVAHDMGHSITMGLEYVKR
jgi:integrase